MSLAPFALVAAGGAAGASLRYALSLWSLAAFGTGFPWGTLAANTLGGLAMGLLIGFTQGEPRSALLLLGTGVLGGFTTFSAFSLETVLMLERGAMGLALIYVGASVVLAVGLVWLGLGLARAWP